MNEPTEITGESLKLLRGSKGLNQTEVGEIIGLDGYHVSNIEKGRRAISPSEMKLLRLYFFGEIPFDLVHQEKPLGTILEFTEDEWKIIEILALRAGQKPPQWIRGQILAYLDHNPRAAEARKEAGHSKGVLAVVARDDDSTALHWIDLHGGVAAGSPIASSLVPEPIPATKPYPDDHYALRVFGDSMAPRINDGDTIVVRAKTEAGYPKKGTVVVYSDGAGSTLKVFGYRKKSGHEIESGEEITNFGLVPVLSSLNPAFPGVQTMDGGKIDAIYVETLHEA